MRGCVGAYVCGRMSTGSVRNFVRACLRACIQGLPSELRSSTELPCCTINKFLTAGLKLPCVFMKVTTEVPLKLQRFGETPRVLTGRRGAVVFFRGGGGGGGGGLGGSLSA